MTRIRRDPEAGRTLAELIFGTILISAGIAPIGTIFLPGRWYFLGGVIVGAVTAVLLVINMYDSIEAALSMNERRARNYASTHAALRLIVTAVLLAIAVWISVYSFAGLALGVASLKISGLLHKPIAKLFDKYLPVPTDGTSPEPVRHGMVSYRTPVRNADDHRVDSSPEPVRHGMVSYRTPIHESDDHVAGTAEHDAENRTSENMVHDTENHTAEKVVHDTGNRSSDTASRSIEKHEAQNVSHGPENHMDDGIDITGLHLSGPEVNSRIDQYITGSRKPRRFGRKTKIKNKNTD